MRWKLLTAVAYMVSKDKVVAKEIVRKLYCFEFLRLRDFC